MSNNPAGPWGNVSDIPQSSMNWGSHNPRVPNNELDRDAFLQLLIVQLQHQDPLNPMDDRDFIAQMAQFSALEQMVQLNQTFERTQAYGMIGNHVEFSMPHPVTGEWIDDAGQVVAVSRRGNSVSFVVRLANGSEIDVPFDAVTEVSRDIITEVILSEIFNHVTGQRAQDLVGRYVQAAIPGGEGRPPIFIEGRVDSVRLCPSTGQALLSVQGHEVPFPQGVVSVSDGPLLIGSTRFTNGHVVTDVVFQNVNEGGTMVSRAFLVFDGGETRVRLNLLNLAVDAIGFVERGLQHGTRMSHGDVSGVPRSITMREGIPFMNIYNTENPPVRLGQIDLADFLSERAGLPSSNENEGNSNDSNNNSNSGDDDD